MTIQYSQIDRLIRSGSHVLLTDIHGVSASVRLVRRDRQRVYFLDATGHEGVLHRDDIHGISVSVRLIRRDDIASLDEVQS